MPAVLEMRKKKVMQIKGPSIYNLVKFSEKHFLSPDTYTYKYVSGKKK